MNEQIKGPTITLQAELPSVANSRLREIYEKAKAELAHSPGIECVVFCCFGADAARVYRSLLAEPG